jgi:hypothetical protein
VDSAQPGERRIFKTLNISAGDADTGVTLSQLEPCPASGGLRGQSPTAAAGDTGGAPFVELSVHDRHDVCIWNHQRREGEKASETFTLQSKPVLANFPFQRRNAAVLNTDFRAWHHLKARGRAEVDGHHASSPCMKSFELCCMSLLQRARRAVLQ